jgi:hypothetical protein
MARSTFVVAVDRTPRWGETILISLPAFTAYPVARQVETPSSLLHCWRERFSQIWKRTSRILFCRAGISSRIWGPTCRLCDLRIVLSRWNKTVTLKVTRILICRGNILQAHDGESQLDLAAPQKKWAQNSSLDSYNLAGHHREDLSCDCIHSELEVQSPLGPAGARAGSWRLTCGHCWINCSSCVSAVQHSHCCVLLSPPR